MANAILRKLCELDMQLGLRLNAYWRKPMSLPSNDRALLALMKAIRSGALAFVGAGTSIPCGYPSWSSLLDKMRDEADECDPRPPRTSPPLDDNDLLWTAEVYRYRMREQRYLPLLREMFSPRPSDNATAVRQLVKLPIKDFLTTNYDTLIESMDHSERGVAPASVCWSNQDAVREFFASLTSARAPTEQRRVIHLHGRWDEPSEIILTERDYVKRYVSTESTNRLLFGLFMIQPIVFVGFSLTDPDLLALLRQVQASLGPGRPRHHAILGLEHWNNEPTVRQRLEGKYGISAVFYPIVRRADHVSHEGLEILLRRLVDELGAVEKTSSSVLSDLSASPDPIDPNKGHFGGRNKVDGFVLTAEVIPADVRPGWFSVQLKVKCDEPTRPLTEKVTFHLHPSFRRTTRVVTPTDGEVSLRLLAYGAFTAAAVVEQDGKKIMLELDLAGLTAAPYEFRSR